MTAPFGFSVGDFITVIGLTVKIYEAIDGSSESLAEFHETSSELKVFNGVLQELQASMMEYFSSGINTSPSLTTPTASASRSNPSSALQLLMQTKAVLQSSNKNLTKFHGFIESYKGVQSARQRLNYVLFGRKKLEPFRARLQRDVLMLGVLQQEINR